MSQGTGRLAYTELRERVEASEALIAQLFDEIRRLRAQMEMQSASAKLRPTTSVDAGTQHGGGWPTSSGGGASQDAQGGMNSSESAVRGVARVECTPAHSVVAGAQQMRCRRQRRSLSFSPMRRRRRRVCLLGRQPSQSSSARIRRRAAACRCATVTGRCTRRASRSRMCRRTCSCCRRSSRRSCVSDSCTLQTERSTNL